MRSIALLLFCLVLIWVNSLEARSPNTLYHSTKFLNEINKEFANFKEYFNIVYKDIQEEGSRFMIFSENYMRIKEHNAKFNNGSVLFNLELNMFADRSADELRRLRGYKASSLRTGSTYISPAQKQYLPHEINWVEKGAVTPVKNQGNCGSCWAFSTTGSLEGQHFRQSNELISLSEQQLVDCSESYGNMGCNGGLMDNAFGYIKDNGGLDTESSYPYVSGSQPDDQRTCQFKNTTIGATDTGFVDLPEGDEQALMEAVANIGPISVAIDASSSTFQLYKSGVYTDKQCRNGADNLDHGVLVVGYGIEHGVPYWLVKNSWGTVWGDNGYIKMRRNNKNMCGIATKASYPLV